MPLPMVFRLGKHPGRRGTRNPRLRMKRTSLQPCNSPPLCLHWLQRQHSLTRWVCRMGGGDPRATGIQLPSKSEVREVFEIMFSKKQSSTNPPNSCVGFCQRVVYSTNFNIFMTFIIVLSAMTLGLEASKLFSSTSPGKLVLLISISFVLT